MKTNSQDVDKFLVSVIRYRDLELLVVRWRIEGCDNCGAHLIHKAVLHFFVRGQLVGIT
jgi:hypothetical protein